MQTKERHFGQSGLNSASLNNTKHGLDYLLSQLSKIKQTGEDRYIACCPSHDDKNPSLAIRDSNRTILLKCFAGCSAYEIVSAVGMELSDLFPKSDKYSKPVKNPFPATDVLRCIQSETLLVVVTASKLSKGVMLSKSDKQRLLVAAGRIGACYE